MHKQIRGIEENQSFIVEIKSKENHTWQGSVAWVEGKKRENYRSVLELLKLIDSTFEIILQNEVNS